MDTPKEKVDDIIRLADENKTIRQLAAIVNVPSSTTGDIVKKFRECRQTSSNRVGRCGRKKKLSPRTERQIGRASQANPQASAR